MLPACVCVGGGGVASGLNFLELPVQWQLTPARSSNHSVTTNKQNRASMFHEAS